MATKKPIDPYREVGTDQPAIRLVLPAKTAPSQAHIRGTRLSTVTNAIPLAQQLAEALWAARTLIERTPTDLNVIVEQLRGWYYSQHPDERDRLLWQRFLDAQSTHARLEHAIQVVREGLEVERSALAETQVERETLATHRLPVTIEEEAAGTRPEAVRHYQALGIECQQRAAAIAELERLLLAPGQTPSLLSDATSGILEAVVTIGREAFVRRLREAGELEHLRSRFEWLRAASMTHEAEIVKWIQQVGRPLRIPRVAFPWPPASVWQALAGVPAEAPELVWDDDARHQTRRR